MNTFLEVHLPVIISYVIILAQFVHQLTSIKFIKKDNGLIRNVVKNEVTELKNINNEVKEKADLVLQEAKEKADLVLQEAKLKANTVLEEAKQYHASVIKLKEDLDSKLLNIQRIAELEILHKPNGSLDAKSLATQIKNIVAPRRNKNHNN